MRIEHRLTSMRSEEYLERIKRHVPWTATLILAAAAAMEILIWATDDRTHLCEIFGLSPDRPYTLFTYWVVHENPEHAWKNIGQWAFTAPFVECKLRRRWFTATCVITTLAVGLIVQVAIGAELTNGNTGKGLSVIGWMVLVPVAAILLNCFTGNARRLKAGAVLTFLVLGLWAAVIVEEPWTLPVGMLGHIGGTIVGFLVFVVAFRTGRYEFRIGSWGKEYAVTIALAALAIFALLEVAALSNPDS